MTTGSAGPEKCALDAGAAQTKGLAARSVIGMLWTGLSVGALALAEMLSLIVLARLLSPEDFGLYATTLVVVRFSIILSSLSISLAIVQKRELEKRHLRTGFTLSLLLSAMTAALVWTGAPTIADLMRIPELGPVVRAASVVLLFEGFATVAQATAQRALRFRWLAAVDAAAFTIGFLIVGVALAWRGFGIWALMYALVTQQAVRAVLLTTGAPHPKALLLDWRSSAELLHFGGGFTLSRIFTYMAGQADRLVVGRWLGPQALGVFALASQMMTAPAVMVGQVFDRVLFPTMALVQTEPHRIARAYRSAIAACTLIVLPASVVLIILAPELIWVLLGPKWEAVVAPLQILAVGMLFRTSYKLSDCVARATGAVYARAFRQAFFVAAVAGGALAGQYWGLRGVAVGVVAAITTNYFWMAQLSLRLTRLSWRAFLSAHVPGAALAAAVAAIAWGSADILRALQVLPLLLLFDVAILAAAGALLLCWLFPSVFLGNDGRAALRLLVSRLPGWLQRATSRLTATT